MLEKCKAAEFFNFWWCFVYLTIEFLFNSNHIQLEFITKKLSNVDNQKFCEKVSSLTRISFAIIDCKKVLKLNQSYVEVHLKLIIWGFHKAKFGMCEEMSFNITKGKSLLYFHIYFMTVDDILLQHPYYTLRMCVWIGMNVILLRLLTYWASDKW